MREMIPVDSRAHITRGVKGTSREGTHHNMEGIIKNCENALLSMKHCSIVLNMVLHRTLPVMHTHHFYNLQSLHKTI